MKIRVQTEDGKIETLEQNEMRVVEEGTLNVHH